METYTTVKGQVVIPVKLRRKYGIEAGTKIVWIDAGDSIIMRPITKDYLRTLRGSLKGSGALDVLMEERRKDTEKGK